MKLKELYEDGIRALDDAGVESPEYDAFYLLQHVTGIDRASYLLKKDDEVTDKVRADYENVIEIRSSHIPYQYITGEADFFGYTFKVNENVLIPRLDTEVLVEECLNVMKPEAKVLDMCTGSGCIGITLKAERSDIDVTAVDISEEAVKIASENAKAVLGIEGSYENSGFRLIKSDLFGGIEENRNYDMIVSNPPYVTEAEYAELSPEVKNHEPKLALTAGDEGLDIYRRLIPDAEKRLKTGGVLAVEIGYAQGQSVKTLFEESGFAEVRVIKDLAGLDRVVMGVCRY